MRSNGSMRAQIETLIIATSGVQLANGFFNTLISLRVAIENFEATMAGLVLSSYFAGFTLHNIANALGNRSIQLIEPVKSTVAPTKCHISIRKSRNACVRFARGGPLP